MRNNYRHDRERLANILAEYENTVGPFAGLEAPEYRATLIEQIIDSEQRVLYTDRLRERDLDPASADPRNDAFDPLRAALLAHRAGDIDEAAWLVYLFVHFGKHLRSGWRYIRYVYGAFGEAPAEWWTWQRTAADPYSFRLWLDAHQEEFHKEPGRHGFGNHRKYVSLDAWKDQGTGAAVESYVSWVLSAGGDHHERFESLRAQTPESSFDAAYRSLRAVTQFGRTAKFDYLTMLSKLGLVDFRPGHSYIVGATGPKAGAGLLIHGDKNAGAARVLQEDLANFARFTGIRPDVLEDAICNWQKSPDAYLRFSG